MLSLRKHFGTAGLLVAVVALVAALGGSAVAANSGDGATASAKKKNRKGKQGGLNAKQKRQVRNISANIAKRFQGTGPIGPQGVPGLPGAPGSDGDDGSDGSDGDDGSNGAPGKSVEVSAAACGGLGGAEVKQEGAGSGIEVCNGEDGGPGEEGSPWTDMGVLPEGETLTGAWSAALASEAGSQWVPISFPIPLPTELGGSEVNRIAVGAEPPEECENEDHPGEASAENPEADPGELCIYAGAMGSAEYGSIGLSGISKAHELGNGVSRTGAILPITFTGANGFAIGTWAVTAPEAL